MPSSAVGSSPPAWPTRGHHVEVATSRAQSAVDWADVYPPGTTRLAGVTVHRFDGTGPRDNDAFDAKTVERPVERRPGVHG